MAKEKSNELNIEEVKAILEEAKAEAERIVSEAKKSAEAIKAANEPEKTPEQIEEEERVKKILAENEEYVEIRIFKGTGKYAEDVVVGVNGEYIRIKRGERVKIKRKFAKMLECSEQQEYELSKLIEAATNTKKLADM